MHDDSTPDSALERSDPESTLARLVESVATCGWAVAPDFLTEEAALALAAESRQAWEAGAFRRAAVGRGESLAIREDIRRDHVMWLREGELTATQARWMATLECLRQALNQRLFIGLFEYEGHFAVYPPGAFYRPHLDRHQHTQDRLVTVILYLNPDWRSGDGGELRLWTMPGAMEGPPLQVEPRLGTVVCFLAGDHWHEVLPAHRDRISITGWFRCRAG